MSKKEQTKWDDFLKWISNHSSRVYYRGESNNNYLLKPKVGRFNYNLEDEINMLEHFKRRSNMFVKANNDLEWLAIAQHHGLPTRLLDWTSNPLVACFFAINSLSNNTARIYCLDNCENEYLDLDKEKSPFYVENIKIVHSPIVTNRIELQKGLFSIHPFPNKPVLIGSKMYDGSGLKNTLIEVENNYRFNLNPKPLFSELDYEKEIKNYTDSFYTDDKPFFEIESEYKEHFNKMIRKLGINETIYGDIDSIAKNIEYLKNNNELSKITTISDDSLKPSIEYFVENEIINYLKNDKNIFNNIFNFKIFENKLFFKFGNYINSKGYFKTFIGNLYVSTNFNYLSLNEFDFIHIEINKISTFQLFLNKIGIDYDFRGEYKFDIDLKIQLLYLERKFTFSKVEVLNFSKEYVEYFKKEFETKEMVFNHYKNQISDEDFNVIFDESLSDKKLEKFVEKYKNIEKFDDTKKI